MGCDVGDWVWEVVLKEIIWVDGGDGCEICVGGRDGSWDGGGCERLCGGSG